jgi:uncharacterized protein (TIGR01777 family)
MRVFVTGGTGLVGTRLIKCLLERGDEPVVLTRRYAEARQHLGAGVTLIEGDPMRAGDWQDAVTDCDAVINLAGENIFARRWSEKFKNLLRDSRTQSTANVVEALARKPRTARGQPKTLINASAIGIYGPHGDDEVTEESPPGNDFLARICVEWENAAQQAEPLGVRVAIVRIGVVLERGGGALSKMLTPFKLGVGGKVGSGTQWMSWVHNADVVGILLFALENAEAHGPFNATAPNSVTNKDFSKELGYALRRPSYVPTPAFALRLGLGEVADVITTGQRVLPQRALEAGYTFRFPTLEAALADVVG